LLEPSRTNLAVHSEYLDSIFNKASGVSFEDNATTSPEGVVNAAKLTNSNASFSGAYYVNMSFTNNDTMVASIFAKEGTISNMRFGITNQVESAHIYYQFNLSTGTFGNEDQTGGMTNYSADIQDYGNGWYRCIVIGTFPSSGVTSGGVYPRIEPNGYLYLYGLQVEKNVSYPTSYLPTYGTSATRNGDIALKTGISSLIGQTAGTLFFDWIMNHESPNTSEDLYTLTMSDGTGNKVIGINNYNQTLAVFIKDTTTQFFDNSYTSGADGARIKLALAYANNDVALYINGAQIATDSSASIPTLSQVRLNTFWNGNLPDSSSVNQLLLFKTRLSNSDLATLTSL